MTGVRVIVEPQGLDLPVERLSRLEGMRKAELLEVIGAVTESQTRRRLAEDKAAPDGAPWAPWSPRYAKTRKGHHKLLESDGDLIGSIDHLISGDQVMTGSPLVYAARHQTGDGEDGAGIPAREYLGLSGDDISEVHEVTIDWLDATMEGS